MASVVPPLELDTRVCEQARTTRDARFDGLFFVGVTSTGIFCRTVCPAPPAKSKHVRYYASAAAARAAGLRPCMRCRPEWAPGATSWRLGNELVAGALRLIDDGLLDAAPVAALAERVGVGERQLRRLFADALGATPQQVAATRRLLFAKQLLGDTALPITDIGLAAGYRSVRRFNTAFRDSYGMAPRELRRARVAAAAGELRLRLAYREPYDFEGLLAFFARRALPGVETVDEHGYQRHFVCDGEAGTLRVTRSATGPALDLRVRHPSVRALPDIVARVRRLFDVDADAQAIADVLGRDRMLAKLLHRHPGVRLCGGWSGFEMAVRAVLGQQVSVAAARTLAVRVVECWGMPVATDAEAGAFAFPTPDALADADLGSVGLTRARAQTIRTVAQAVVDGRVDFRPEQGLDAFVQTWTALPGIGPWTAHYIAMRGLGHPDAFPAADLILRRVAGADAGPLSTRELERRSQAWRPWRAYATLLMWRAA
ncbi:MAG TPA: AlkA N-terminal domain-containing protein [Oleiagrimonas sp.]|nr:AlkA N-terminal domain-containing protein [Oleiagrimonas sp.]